MNILVILSTIGSLILIDLILSGDNALVIGAVAAKLPRRQRLLAIIVGGGCAILLRIGFTIIATLLLEIPLLQVIGAALIYYIAIKLLRDRDQEEDIKPAQEQPADAGNGNQRFLSVMWTIVVADVSMSLDNVLAIGALAAGNFLAIGFGLLLSIIILLVAAAIVAELISRFTWLLDLASIVLAWTAARMVLSDGFLGPRIEGVSTLKIDLPVVGSIPVIDIVIYGLFVIAMLAVDLFLRRSRRSAGPASEGKTAEEPPKTFSQTD
jgi:YjbE family integral membrane protein